MIQTNLHTAIRLSIGGFKSCPIDSIRNIANKITPDRRIEKLLLFCATIKKNINNLAVKSINTYIHEAGKEKIMINNIIERKPYIFHHGPHYFMLTLPNKFQKKKLNALQVKKNIQKHSARTFKQ